MSSRRLALVLCVVALTACGTTSTTFGEQRPCESGAHVDDSFDSSGGGQRTPELAAASFAEREGDGPLAPPASGWTRTDEGPDGVTLQAGRVEVRASRLDDGSWLVGQGRCLG